MPDDTRDLLTQGLDAWGIAYSEAQIEQFLLYRDLLVDWNTNRMNLTRLISPREIAVDHFLDSLSLTRVLQIPANCKLLDVGAGAGFPSLPLKILRPDLHVTLLEATAKKLTFCQEICDRLGLADVDFMHGRAEQIVPSLSRRFDIVTARAVASLDKLIPWCEPYMKLQGGVLALLKGSKVQEELKAAKSELRELGLRADVTNVIVPCSERVHAVVVCRRRDR